MNSDIHIKSRFYCIYYEMVSKKVLKGFDFGLEAIGSVMFFWGLCK